VKKHRGDISVRSEVGVGSTFRVELPVRQSKAAV
jgi:two-component system NtrC family sensor kinase